MKLEKVMELDLLFLDPELNLKKVSLHSGINSRTISAILNHHYQQSFNEFVNNYRIQEVKKKLLSSKNNYLTISGLALESGFNSQATFQRVFKNSTGMSPRQYQNEQLKKIN